MKFRTIEQRDNATIAKIIRSSLDSHGLGIPGTVYTDPTTDDLYTLFKNKDSIYYIAEEGGKVLGGCGLFPTKGLPDGYIELVKLYLSDEAKGQGLGEKLMRHCITWAKKKGYTHLYLETINELSSAIKLYKKLSFKHIDHPLGDSGHNACEIWMQLEV